MKEIQKLIEIEKMRAKIEVLEEVIQKTSSGIDDYSLNVITDILYQLNTDIEKKRKLINIQAC